MSVFGYCSILTPTKNTVAVAEAFGLGIDEEKEFQIYDNVELKIGPKEDATISGYGSESSLRHVHCPRCRARARSGGVFITYMVKPRYRPVGCF